MGRLRIDRLTPPPVPLRRGAELLAGRCHRAATPLPRLVGLLGTPDLGADEALWLTRCGAVHAIGLRVRIGCAFLDRDGRVLRVVDPLPRRGARERGADAVVECRSGVLDGVRPGDVLRRGEIPATSDIEVTGGG